MTRLSAYIAAVIGWAFLWVWLCRVIDSPWFGITLMPSVTLFAVVAALVIFPSFRKLL